MRHKKREKSNEANANQTKTGSLDRIITENLQIYNSINSRADYSPCKSSFLTSGKFIVTDF